MALYLNEAWLREPSPESFREFIEAFGSLSGEAEQLGLSSDMFRLGRWARDVYRGSKGCLGFRIT